MAIQQINQINEINPKSGQIQYARIKTIFSTQIKRKQNFQKINFKM